MAYCRGVHWDRFFEDLEDQLDSEWEAERAALDTEAERLRIARVPLHDRLVAMSRMAKEISIHVGDASQLVGRLTRVGADWCAVVPDAATRAHAHTQTPAPAPAPAPATIVPLAAIVELGAPAEVVLEAVRDAQPGSALALRMGLGFVLRDLARRRTPVTVGLVDGRSRSGTIDRAGADHLDLALHDRGAPRRMRNVTGYRIVPFPALRTVRLDDPVELV